MDGTFGGGDLISASLAIMLGGGTDAELHDKEVTLTTSDVTGSQTAIFEYDPQNEPVTGDPPGPWDGYSLFTIDLSGVKDDIEDLRQQIADAEVCRQQVIAVLQQYDPDYDPAEGECPASKVDDLYDDYYEDEQTIADLQEQIEECDQCKADVIAKLQEYDPDFDPQTCGDIPPEIDKIADEESGFDPPIGTPIEDIIKIMGSDDTVEIEGNTYHFDYYVWERNTDVHYPLYTLFEGTPQQSYSVAPQMNVYDSNEQLVATEFIAETQSQGVLNGYKYQVTSATIDYSNKLLIVAYQIIDNWGNVITGTANNNISAYLDTTSPNPQYRVKNS